jgi:hypothetical protein
LVAQVEVMSLIVGVSMLVFVLENIPDVIILSQKVFEKTKMVAGMDTYGGGTSLT